MQKLQSRFACHILTHEDVNMMFTCKNSMLSCCMQSFLYLVNFWYIASVTAYSGASQTYGKKLTHAFVRWYIFAMYWIRWSNFTIISAWLILGSKSTNISLILYAGNFSKVRTLCSIQTVNNWRFPNWQLLWRQRVYQHGFQVCRPQKIQVWAPPKVTQTACFKFVHLLYIVFSGLHVS